jgi:anhydro-N-acetylmuramic acid kinase
MLMNKNVEKLYRISNKRVRTIIGLMSGTSVDGLDVALCHIEGHGSDTKLTLMNFETVAFDAEMKAAVKSVFSKKQIELEKLTLLNPWIALQHAGIINSLLKKWKIKNEEVDLVASHGQTIYHAPKILHQQVQFGNATLQIGDGDHLAVATGIITISDFRQKHIAAGGEGAPLAVYGDHLIFGKQGEDRIMLNIGGIANFTYLPATTGTENIFCTDTGPGNTMMDALMQRHFPGKYYDAGAAVALKGKINAGLLTALKENIFFNLPFPKTTGPELFNLDYLQLAKDKTSTQNICIEDTMATLNKFSADTIVSAVLNTTDKDKPYKIFSSGGGMHNPLMMQHIKTQLPNCEFYTTADLEINPDAKEAVLFALLANECVSGNVSTFGKGTKGMPVISMGKVSFPF